MRYIVLKLFFLMSLSLYLNASPSNTITPPMIYYYHELQKSKIVPKEYLSYKIFKMHNSWHAKEVQYEDATTVTPYMEDKYLQIDQESGDGVEILSLKLWKNNNNKPLICITKNLLYQNSKIICVSKEHKKWYRVGFTPQEDISVFLSDDMSIKDLNILKNIV